MAASRAAFLLLFILPFSLAAPFQRDANIDKQIVKDVFIGVLEGVAYAEIPHLEQCIQDSTPIVNDVESAIEAFKKKNHEGVKKGLELLMQAVEALPQAMKDCGASLQDAKKLLELIKVVKSPSSLVYHVGKNLIVNGREIFHEINAAIDAYHNQQWREMGKDIGIALAKFVIGEPAPLSLRKGGNENKDLQKAVQILVGVLKGLGAAEESMKDIEFCVMDAEDIINKVDQAMTLFHKKTAKSVKDALALLSDAFHSFPETLKTCKVATKEAEELKVLLDIFKHPMQFMYKAGKNLVVNGVEIFQDINNAIGAYKDEKYEDFGMYVADAFVKLLLKMKSLTSEEQLAITEEFVNELNSMNADGASWTAAMNPKFRGMTLKEAKKYLGTFVKPLDAVVGDYRNIRQFVAVPDSFDARTAWPKCIHPIRDQQRCGSCWAFAATEALSDRFCIASNGTIDVVLSPQDMVACDRDDFGCSGGYLDKAWNYLEKTGVVSDACMPYTAGSGVAGACPSTCTASGQEWKKYKVQSGSVRQFYDVASIQLALMTSGPLEVGFTVYQDFMSYKSGIYYHKSGGVAGGHAVKLVGWGTENGVDYWILANSWGPSWGENGFFRIKRGNNECDIESNVIAGLPLIE